MFIGTFQTFFTAALNSIKTIHVVIPELIFIAALIIIYAIISFIRRLIMP
jgi:hypothetical protein